MNRKILSLLVGTSTALLVACGGGGGGSGANAPVAPVQQAPTFVAITPATIQAAYGAEELAAYNALMNARNTCGFGGLNQNAALDKAATAHNSWQANNNLFGHYEPAGTPGTTGLYAADRAVAAGYTGLRTAGEELTVESGSNISKTGFGVLAIQRLLSAPYHLQGSVGPQRDIGVSISTSGPIGSGADFIVTGYVPARWAAIETASSTGSPEQRQAADSVLTYPCAGITQTAYALEAETPNPVPGRDLRANPVGQPIFIQVLAGRVLNISNATVTGPSGSVQLLPTMTSANDQAGILLPSQAVILPNAPLAQNTTYAVSITGTNNGTPFSRNFNFSTGSTR